MIAEGGDFRGKALNRAVLQEPATLTRLVKRTPFVSLLPESKLPWCGRPRWLVGWWLLRPEPDVNIKAGRAQTVWIGVPCRWRQATAETGQTTNITPKSVWVGQEEDREVRAAGRRASRQPAASADRPSSPDPPPSEDSAGIDHVAIALTFTLYAFPCGFQPAHARIRTVFDGEPSAEGDGGSTGGSGREVEAGGGGRCLPNVLGIEAEQRRRLPRR